MIDLKFWAELAVKAMEAVGAEKLIKSLLQRKHYVILVGSTGVGKTALSAALDVVEQSLVDVINRTENPKSSRTRIKGEKVILIDTPGELAKVASRMSEMATYYNRARVGILIVVADGYHEYRQTDETQVDTPEKLGDFLNRHRQIEVDHLISYAAQFQFAQSVNWALTVATKADLWWSRRADVLAHYASPQFQDIAKRLCPYGAPVRAFSSATEPFLRVVPSDNTFAESTRRKVREAFLETFFQQLSR